MIKMICTFLLLFCTASGAFTSDFDSRLETGGRFLNRLRFNFEGGSAGIVSSTASGELEFAEPYFRSAGLEAGRLVLKGLLREHYNPEAGGSDAAVYLENGTASVTSSYGRSSRAGVLVLPRTDIGGFGFRSNEGGVSLGVFKTGCRVSDHIETDFLVTAGNTQEPDPDSAFSGYPLYPAQWIVNPSVELRFLFGAAAGAETGGCRKNMLPAAAEPGVALSFLTIGCIPQYTQPAAVLRFYGSAGSRCINISLLFRTVAGEFIDAGGGFNRELLSAGASVNMQAGTLELSSGYNYRIDRPEVQPAGFFPSAHEGSAKIKMNADIGQSLEAGAGGFGEIECTYDKQGAELIDAEIELQAWVKILNILQLKGGGEFSFDDINGYQYSESTGFYADLLLDFDRFEAGVKLEYDDNPQWKAGFTLLPGEHELWFSTGRSVEDGVLFSAGFKTEW